MRITTVRRKVGIAVFGIIAASSVGAGFAPAAQAMPNNECEEIADRYQYWMSAFRGAIWDHNYEAAQRYASNATVYQKSYARNGCGSL